MRPQWSKLVNVRYKTKNFIAISTVIFLPSESISIMLYELSRTSCRFDPSAAQQTKPNPIVSQAVSATKYLYKVAVFK